MSSPIRFPCSGGGLTGAGAALAPLRPAARQCTVRPVRAAHHQRVQAELARARALVDGLNVTPNEARAKAANKDSIMG